MDETNILLHNFCFYYFSLSNSHGSGYPLIIIFLKILFGKEKKNSFCLFIITNLVKKASDLQVFERCHLQKLIPFDVIEIHSSVVHGFSIIITTENKRKSIGLHAKSKQNKQQKKKKLVTVSRVPFPLFYSPHISCHRHRIFFFFPQQSQDVASFVQRPQNWLLQLLPIHKVSQLSICLFFTVLPA